MDNKKQALNVGQQYPCEWERKQTKSNQKKFLNKQTHSEIQPFHALPINVSAKILSHEKQFTFMHIWKNNKQF